MIHGGDIYTEGVLKGKSLIDFSSNINPLGVPESFKKAIDTGIASLVNYPDIQYRELKDALSRYENVPAEWFLLGNGAAEIIDLALKDIKSVLIMAPAFAEYELSARKHKNSVRYFYMSERENPDGTFSKYIDYDLLKKELEQVDGVILANPNNPDGSMLHFESMIDILEFCNESGKRVVIDEAFIHFTLVDGGSFVQKLEEYPCLLVIKALTKYYGMPGIRFGYGITSDDSVRKRIHDSQNPWNINSFAELAAKIVLFDQEYNRKSIQWINECREEFIQGLMKSGRFEKVYRTFGNYVLCQLKKETSADFQKMCMEDGILIRNADNYEGLSDRHIRLALKSRELNKKIIDRLNR